MRKFCCLFMALCLLPLCACAGPDVDEQPEAPATPSEVVQPQITAPADVEFIWYDDDTVIFSYPADWQNVPSPIAGGITYAAPVDRGVFAANVSIVRQDTGLTLSFEQFKSFAGAQYEQMGAVFTQTDILLNGKPALYYDIYLPAEYGNGTPLRMVQYVLQKGSSFYVLAMLETAQVFDAQAGLFAYIGQTFDLR